MIFVFLVISIIFLYKGLRVLKYVVKYDLRRVRSSRDVIEKMIVYTLFGGLVFALVLNIVLIMICVYGVLYMFGIT